MSKLLNKKGFISKMATSFSFLFAVLLLLSLPGESADIVSPQEETLVPSSFSSPTGGFSYNAWRDSGKPIEEGNDWASGTFIIKTPSGDLYRSRLSSAWREAAASALDITPLVREQLLLQANDTNTDTSATLGGYGNAALLNFVDKTTDGLLGGLLDSGRELNWVKTLDGEFRAQAGDRPWSLGLGGILSLHERQDSAIGLQFYGNSGENSRGYSGLFYRQALGTEHLLGINSFVDYEEDTERNDDGFWRWTLGGEWRTNWADLRANHYLGLTEGKIQSDGAYIYTADGSDIALNLHAPQAGWLSGELKYYQWDGQYGDADEEGIKYGIQVAPTGLSNLNFNIGYDNPLDGKGSWEGGFTWSHNFGESASSSGGGLRFNARDNFYRSSRSSETRQRIRKGLPQAKGSAQTALIFTPENLDITLSYPVSNYLILANVNEFASGGQGNISYAVSSLNSDVNVAMAANANGTHLWWHSLPTQAGNFVIPVVATDEAGAKATLLVNVNAIGLHAVSEVANVTLSYPVKNYLLLANVNDFFSAGIGRISYAVSSPDLAQNGVGLRANANGTHLWWSALPGKGYYTYNIVATDEAGFKATFQLNVEVKKLRIHAVRTSITVRYSLPLENYLILPGVDSFFYGGIRNIRYSANSGAGVVKNSNGGYDLYWHRLPTNAGDVVIDVVAIDDANESGKFFGWFDPPNDTAVSRVVVKLESISAVPDALDITLSLPLSNSRLLSDVASFFSGGRAGGVTSYVVSSPDSADVVLVDNVSSINLYWNRLSTRVGNFRIPIVATDAAGYRATLQLNVKTESSLRAVSEVANVTLSYPVSNYLILANVHDFFSDGIGRISYEVSSPENVALGANGNGTHLWWRRLPGAAGGFGVEIVATDEVGGRATLRVNMKIKSISAVSEVTNVTLSHPVSNYLILANAHDLFSGGIGRISYEVSSPGNIALGANGNGTHLWWQSLPTTRAGVNTSVEIVATDEAGGRAVLQVNVTAERIIEGRSVQQAQLVFSPESLDITLSYPVSNYLILANVNEFASGGQGNISYAVSSPNSDVNVAMAANANGTHLWWHSLPTQAGNFVIPVVATDEAGAKATLLVNVASVRELSVRAVVLDVLNLTLSYPVRNYLLLPDLGSLFTGGQGSINYRVSSPDSPDGGRGGVDLVKNNATDFYLNWSSFPKEGRYRYNIVATDGGFAEGIGTRATVQLDVKVQRITAAPNVLDIALLFPVRNYLLLPNVDSFFTGELGSTSYTVSSSDSDVNVALAANANGTHLYWHSLPTRPGNFVIPVVATDQETGAKATLQLNVKVNTIISEQDVLDITLSYPVSNYLILANVDSFFTRVLENISYTASSPNSDVNVAMATNANGTHLYWHSLPTRPGNFVIPVVATDEIGGKATLQVNVKILQQVHP